MHTAIVVPMDSRPLASSMITENVIVLENVSGLRYAVRGRSISKIVLVGLTKDELDTELAADLVAASAVCKSQGTDVPFLEV